MIEDVARSADGATGDGERERPSSGVKAGLSERAQGEPQTSERGCRGSIKYHGGVARNGIGASRRGRHTYEQCRTEYECYVERFLH